MRYIVEIQNELYGPFNTEAEAEQYATRRAQRWLNENPRNRTIPWAVRPLNQYRSDTRICADCGTERVANQWSLPQGQYRCHPCRKKRRINEHERA